ncbi:MAG TPA: hypothetical protein VH740_26010 [Vicinamibacterales bacterium]|jgi:hypothetical protein
MKRSLALLLCAILSAPACATSRGPRIQTAPEAAPTAGQHPAVNSASDRAVLSDFARQLPVGARVKARVGNNRTIRGTILKVTDHSIFLQPRTRIAERIEEVPFDQLLALEQDLPGTGSNAGRTAAIAASAAAGGTLAVLLILAAIFSD